MSRILGSRTDAHLESASGNQSSSWCVHRNYLLCPRDARDKPQCAQLLIHTSNDGHLVYSAVRTQTASALADNPAKVAREILWNADIASYSDR